MFRPARIRRKSLKELLEKKDQDLKLRLFVSYRQENAKDAAISAVTLSASLMKRHLSVTLVVKILAVFTTKTSLNLAGHAIRNAFPVSIKAVSTILNSTQTF